MTEFEYKYLEEAYATHQPFLEAYVRSTTGDIIEFGTGDMSTGFLRMLLKGTDRQLISIEDCKEWYEKMISEYPPTETHKYIYLSPKDGNIQWDEFLATFTHPRPISVVFIDQADLRTRALTCNILKNRTEYIIMHDANHFPQNNMLGRITDPSLPYTDISKYDFSEVFKLYYMYFPPPPWSEIRRAPPTLVGTNFDLPIIPYRDIEFNY
jgi:hypothetical protein